MNCPLCVDEVLEPRVRQGVEIDICPRCRGMWLDRGELDRFLGGDEPSRGAARQRDDRSRDRDRDDRSRDDRYRDDRYRDDDRYRKPPKSKKKRLADLFEEVLDF